MMDRSTKTGKSRIIGGSSIIQDDNDICKKYDGWAHQCDWSTMMAEE